MDNRYKMYYIGANKHGMQKKKKKQSKADLKSKVIPRWLLEQTVYECFSQTSLLALLGADHNFGKCRGP
jgi:hypothetical protein